MEISTKREEKLVAFCAGLGLQFHNIELLNRAFVHTSYTNENNISHLESYERLEFLGDAVLKIITSEFLYNSFKEQAEGSLSMRRAWIVSDKSLAEFAKKINLGSLILLGRNEEHLMGREKTSILACAFEAFLGAIFLEYKQLGLKAATDFLIDNFKEEFLTSAPLNFKAILQEYTQSDSHKLPVYKVLDESGKSNDKIYTIGVYYNDVLVAKGIGKSKKDAEQEAARLAINELNLIREEK